MNSKNKTGLLNNKHTCINCLLGKHLSNDRNLVILELESTCKKSDDYDYDKLIFQE